MLHGAFVGQLMTLELHCWSLMVQSNEYGVVEPVEGLIVDGTLIRLHRESDNESSHSKYANDGSIGH